MSDPTGADDSVRLARSPLGAKRLRRFLRPIVILLMAGAAGVALAVGVLRVSTGAGTFVADQSRPPSAAAGSPSAGLDVAPGCALTPAPTTGPKPVSGTLYYDKNQNGRQDPGEPGLPGIAVYLSRGADSETPGVEKSPATCTDAQGRYRLVPPDSYNGYRVEVRTGWTRSHCAGLACGPDGPGNNLQAGPEWIFSAVVTGRAAQVYNGGLIPDSGQYLTNPDAQTYSGYPPSVANAHPVDLAARFTDDQAGGCRTTTNGISCQIGQSLAQTLYIANSGTRTVTGVHAVIQLPYGEVHRTLTLLKSGSSRGVTGISKVSVVPALGPRPKGKAATTAHFTTITFTLDGSIPPAGLAAVVSQGSLVSSPPGTQLVGRAGITAEDDQAADVDSGFCPDPAIARSCLHVSDTYSWLDLRGDDNDSDQFTVVGP